MLKKLIALAAVAAVTLPAQATLSAGDIALIGRINNGTPDSFAFVALSNIGAGEVIYFTDNGWTGTGFRGASATDGDGNENLTRWTAASAVAAGTIVASTSSGFTTSGAIAGTSSGSYANLALGQGAEQIYAFQGAASNPLFTTAAQTHLYLLDDSNGFEVATSSSTGGVASGLVQGTTAITLSYPAGGGMHVKTSVLAGAAKSKAEWLATFANAGNWEAGTPLPTAAIAVTAVPEPERYALMLAGLAALGFVVRRRQR